MPHDLGVNHHNYRRVLVASAAPPTLTNHKMAMPAAVNYAMANDRYPTVQT
ncbi:hypothetical protein [Nostoc sp.]|uniref:hypothetical protein n=1 Tax=Nostoc sp. TaxID=1180 RepID=UPI002FFBCCF1